MLVMERNCGLLALLARHLVGRFPTSPGCKHGCQFVTGDWIGRALEYESDESAAACI
jgi:hypothetical protein